MHEHASMIILMFMVAAIASELFIMASRHWKESCLPDNVISALNFYHEI